MSSKYNFGYTSCIVGMPPLLLAQGTSDLSGKGVGISPQSISSALRRSDRDAPARIARGSTAAPRDLASLEDECNRAGAASAFLRLNFKSGRQLAAHKLPWIESGERCLLWAFSSARQRMPFRDYLAMLAAGRR